MQLPSVYGFRAYWLLLEPPGLPFTYSTFSPHGVFMRFV